MRLLVDEMFPGWIAARFRDAGIDVVAVVERDDLRGQSDDDLFAYAQNDDRAILTANYRDFVRIARANTAHGAVHNGLFFVNNRRYSRAQLGTLSRITQAMIDYVQQDQGPDVASDREVWL